MKSRKIDIEDLPDLNKRTQVLFCDSCGETKNFKVSFIETRYYEVEVDCDYYASEIGDYESEEIDTSQWKREQDIYFCKSCNTEVFMMYPKEVWETTSLRVDKNWTFHSHFLPERKRNKKIMKIMMAKEV